MTEIKRFVSYIYMYNSGVKGSNVGFAKVDSRNGQCKIAVNIKGLEFSNGKSEKVYLFYRKQEKILGIYIGSFQIVNGIGEFQEQFQTENIKAADLSLDEMNGIFIREEDRNERVFASGWDDYAILVNQFSVHKGKEDIVSDREEGGLLRVSEVEEKRKEPVIFFDRNWRSEELVEEQPVEAGQKELILQEGQTENTIEEKEVDADVGVEKASVEMVKADIEVGTDSVISQGEETTIPEVQDKLGSDYEQKTEKQKEDLEREIKRGRKMDIMQKEEGGKDVEEPSKMTESFKTKEEDGEQDFEKEKGADGVETAIIEDANGERSNKKVHTTENEIENKTERKQQDLGSVQGNGLLWGTHTPGAWKEMSWEEYQEKEQQLRKQVQTCIYSDKKKQDMGKQESLVQEMKQPEISNTVNVEETAWEKLCHQFPKIRAFVDEPESLCLKIDLQDLRMLAQENWVLGSNSFLLHGYYNFRYLILTQEEEEFVLGVPGIYHPNEKMMASMFGFGDFKPVKDCEKMLGQFGYWCKKVAL